MKVFTVLLVSALFLPAFSYADRAGGGGFKKVPDPVTEQDVKNAFRDDEEPLKQIFKSLEWSSIFVNEPDNGEVKTFPNLKSALAKVFSKEGPSIYSIIDVVKPEVVPGLCYHQNVAKDASTSGVGAAKLCVSQKSFLEDPKVNIADLKSVALALLVHEYSHLKGTSEEEANDLQSFVFRQLNVTGKEYASSRLLWELNYLEARIRLLKSAGFSDRTLCVGVGALHQNDLFDIILDYSHTGLVPLRPNGIEDVALLAFKVYNLSNYCQPVQNPMTRSETFGQRTQMGASEYMESRGFTPARRFKESDFVVRNLSLEDRDQKSRFTAEIADIEKLLASLRKSE